MKHIMYQHNHGKPMSVAAMAQLVSNTLYYKRFFPYYTYNLVCGLDEQGVSLCVPCCCCCAVLAHELMQRLWTGLQEGVLCTHMTQWDPMSGQGILVRYALFMLLLLVT